MLTGKLKTGISPEINELLQCITEKVTETFNTSRKHPEIDVPICAPMKLKGKIHYVKI